MTSRISFVKKLKEELKHHLVSMFAVLLVTLAQILGFYFELQQYLLSNRGESDYVRKAIASMVAPRYWEVVPSICLAVLLAAEFFLFLHSRKKSDFYLSLPAKRTEQFWLGAGTCGIIFLIPFGIEIIAKIIMVYASGYGTSLFMYSIFWKMICTILSFAISWVTMVLAMTMTGNTLIALMGFAAFSGYMPVILRNLVPTFQEMFYLTFCRVPEDGTPWYYFSPVGLARGMTGVFYTWGVEEHMKFIIAGVVFLVVVSVITIWLYKKRPAEAAGRAMAFEKANPYIRFAVVIPLSLYCGVLLYELSVKEHSAWLVAGTILGGLIIHGMMNCIFTFDMRKMFSDKRQFVLSCFVCIAFLAWFEFDVTKYDSYVPEASEVERIYISLSDNYVSYTNEININSDEGVHDGISGKNINPALALVENAIAQMDHTKTRYGQYTDGVHADEKAEGSITLYYLLNNGKVKGRTYSISFDKKENRALLDMIFATSDMKDDFYNLYAKKHEEIIGLSLNAMLYDRKILLSKEEQRKFVEIYLKEFSQMSYTDSIDKDRIASVYMFYNNSDSEEYYIYENFDETLGFLEKQGYKVAYPFASCDMLSLSVYDEMGENTLEVTDAETLEKYKDEILLDQYYQSYYMYGVKDSSYGNVRIELNGQPDSRNIIIRNSTISEIKNDLKK